MNIILETHGLILKKQRNSFLIAGKKESRLVSPLRVSTITIAGDCQISSSAISLAIEHGIPIFYLNSVGKVFAKIYAKKFVSNEIIRVKQTFFQWTPDAITWIKKMIQLKAEHQVLLITESLNDENRAEFELKHRNLLRKLEEIKKDSLYLDIQGIMNIEAKLGVNYWNAYFSLFPSMWKPGPRNVRPAGDPVNACINYFYGFNYSLVEHAIYLAGLNPYQGLLHQNQYNKPVLSYDLIEPFRPFTDRFVLQIFRDGLVDNHYFDPKKGGYYLNRVAKKKLIPLFYEYLDEPVEFDGKEASYRRHIYDYAQELRKLIEKVDLDRLVDNL